MTVTGLIRVAVTLAVAAVVASTPADARRFRFGFGGSGTDEQIERVAELPDRDPYLHDNVAWDLGWFYSRHKLAGITTSSAYKQGKFVLYHGDRYILLDDEKLALITLELGSDPTKAFRAEHEAEWAADKAKAAADAASLKDNLIERRPGETTAAYHARARAVARQRSAHTPTAADGVRQERSSALGSTIMGVLLMIGLIVGLGRVLSRRNRRTAIERGAEGLCDPALPSFDERVAARLRELDAAGSAPGPVPVATAAPIAAPAMPAPVRPGVRTFGRRVTA